jgi:hypothetical protein
MPFGGLLTAGLIAGGGSILSGLLGSNAATKASQQEVSAQEQALAFQEQEYNQQQQNQAPFLQAGQYSIGQLQADLAAGTFGPGSQGAAPQFSAPTLQEAQNTPGYQFQQEQGDLGITRGAAAAGGAVTGGTLAALDAYNVNSANSNYNTLFNQALSGYGASLNTYTANLNAQQQAFNQLATPAAIGEGAAVNLGTTGAAAANTVGSTLGSIGNAQAAGTIGSTNAITGAITGATQTLANGIALPNYLAQLSQANTPNYGGGQNLPPTFGNGTVATPVPYQPPESYAPLPYVGGGAG